MVMPMTKLIAARYLVENEDATLATDTKSPDEEVVQIKCWKRPKLDDLVHAIYLRRAKEFSSIRHPAIVPLIDYGFDGQHSCYFVTYQMSTGTATTRLSHRIKQGVLSIDQTVPILLDLTNALTHLHLNNFYGGYFDAVDVLVGSDPQKPMASLNMAGLEGFEILLGLDESIKQVSQRNFVEEDIAQLAHLAITMLTRQRDPSPETVEKLIKAKTNPPSFIEFLGRPLLPDMKRYSSCSEVKRDLSLVMGEIQAKTMYYLLPTKNVAQKLVSAGFVAKAELYMTVDLLNEELRNEKFGRIFEPSPNGTNPGTGQTKYFLTTQRFRLLCVPAQESSNRYLAIIDITFPSPTSLVAEREMGMAIPATLQVALQGSIPANANILPLLDELETFKLVSFQGKQRETEKKSGLEDWKKVLELQKRILDQFQVPYTNWDLIDDGNTLLVELAEQRESLDVSEDERLMMSASSGRRSIPVGYFQELDGKQLKISLLADVIMDDLAKYGRITRDNIQVKSILSRQEDGLRRLRYRESVNPDLLDVLIDPSQLRFDKRVNPTYWDHGLDSNQKDAVKRALAAKDIFLVHGPPGTGKTRTIVELIRQIINTSDGKEQKVLVTSQSNVAVNHALTSLLVQQPGLRETVVRVGREEKAGETLDLLLDQQLQKWAEQVKCRSDNFIDKKRQELNIKPQLAECFSMIDECERIQIDLTAIEQQIQQKTTEYEETSKDLETLHELIGKTESLRREASSLLEQIGTADTQFRAILETFDRNYLGWASTFLQQVNEQAKLSAKRMDLKSQLESLRETTERLQTNHSAGIALVRDSLFEMFKQDLPGLEQQKTFVKSKLAVQQDIALEFARIQKISQDWTQRISRGVTEFEGAYLSRCQVVGATCIGVAAKGDVSEMEFDWVIVDEAGRSTHPELIVPLVRGKKIVLVGDHRQLPPIIDKELTEDLLEEIEVERTSLETSLFKELIEPVQGEAPTTQLSLQVQYRMHPAIGNMISKCFYKSQLRHADSVRMIDHGQKWIRTPITWFTTNNLSLHNEQKVGYSFQNVAEAEMIKNILDSMEQDLASQNTTRSVGIIAGYMGQKRLLRQQIGRDLSRWPHLQTEINTVDAYQGQEKDYIIYSVVRSNTERKIGFLQDERRLNVALSRARQLLVIVGDIETAESAKTGARDNPFYRVIQHIRENKMECSIREYGR